MFSTISTLNSVLQIKPPKQLNYYYYFCGVNYKCLRFNSYQTTTFSGVNFSDIISNSNGNFWVGCGTNGYIYYSNDFSTWIQANNTTNGGGGILMSIMLYITVMFILRGTDRLQ
jgi:hypothetical protein